MNDASHNASAPEVSEQELNAQAVLNQTRRELMVYLAGEPVPARAKTKADGEAGATNGTGSNGRARRRSPPKNDVDTVDWMGIANAAVTTWWRGHPLHMAATVLQPVLSDYVRRKPVATLGAAAATGAALVLIRPWRIASVAAVGMSVVRASNLPVMAASLVATIAEKLQKEQS